MEAVPRKNPTVAGILSGLMPGLGQFYCGRWKKGFAFLIGALILDAVLGVSAGFFTLLQAGPGRYTLDTVMSVLLPAIPFLGFALWSVLDAVRDAKRSQA